MPYPEQMVAPMRAELVEMGVQELRTTSEVDDFFAASEGTALHSREMQASRSGSTWHGPKKPRSGYAGVESLAGRRVR